MDADPSPQSITDALRDEAREERAESLSGPESEAGRALAQAIGTNLVRERRAAGLDVATLAARSGLPADDIALVEAGRGLPGLRMLWRLASALRVPFGALLAGTMLSESADPTFRVQRADRGRVVSTAGGLRSRALTVEVRARSTELYDLTLAAGAAEDAEAHAPDTFEHIVVTAGTLTVQVGERLAELGPGDAILFRADAPHRYQNPGGGDARALLIMIYG